MNIAGLGNRVVVAPTVARSMTHAAADCILSGARAGE